MSSSSTPLSRSTSDIPAAGHLLGAADVRRIAADAGISPTKKFGQNFVIDPGTVRRITREAGIHPGMHVLEVGPGLGSLTLALLEAGADVTAVDIDPLLAHRLPQTIAEFMPEASGRVSVINRNALTLDTTALPELASCERFTLVSNLPYNVATPIVLTLLERFDNLDTFLVMVQKEVADRLVATPGSKTYGAPSVKLAWYGHAQRVGLVGRTVFWPAPNVDSALVLFNRHQSHQCEPTPLASRTDTNTAAGVQTSEPANTDSRLYADHNTDNAANSIAHIETLANREQVFRLIDAAFGQRRKTLHAVLKHLVSEDAFKQAGIDPNRRGETLTITEFTRLAACTDWEHTA
jgi:16S rRNA (adenine1518-N6/adenine1519-N6)-dimethyltransferase